MGKKKLKARERIGVVASHVRDALVQHGWKLVHVHHAATGSDYLSFSHPRSIQIRIADHGGGYVPGPEKEREVLLLSGDGAAADSHRTAEFIRDMLAWKPPVPTR